MFRGNASHTGVSNAKLFRGQGGVRWSVRTGGTVRSSPAVTAARVFAGSGDGFLYAVDRVTGKVAWKFNGGSAVHSSPAVAGGLVVAETVNGRIFAVDERSGRLRWSVQTGPAVLGNMGTRIEYDYFISSPVVAGQTVVIGGRDGWVYALDRRTGKQRWRVQTKGRVSGTPAVSDGQVVVGSFDGRVYALDLTTGAERWVFRTIGDTIDLEKAGYDRRAVQSSPVIWNGTVFVGSRDDGLYAIDAKTGAQRWRVSHRISWVVSSPAVDDHGRVFVGSSDGHFVQSVDAVTGRELWRLRTGANMQASPLRIGDAVVVASYDTRDASGDVLVLDATAGTIRWRLRLDGSVISSPAAYDDELYVGTDGGSIVAIHEVSVAVPKLAVYFDSTSKSKPFVAGGRLAFEYFRGIGYTALDEDSLATFLAARIADGAPSAVVFATDELPRTVAPVIADTVLLRRYLNAGGKVVWLGVPIGGLVRDSTGQAIAFEREKSEALLGMSLKGLDGNEVPENPTSVGRRWGIDRWLPGRFMLDTSAVTHALTVDDFGMTAAWVHVYRPDRPGSGYVQLWGFGASLERLSMIRAAAEYGLLRKADTAAAVSAADAQSSH